MKIWPPEVEKAGNALSSVDFPQPDGPSSTMNSPAYVEVEVLEDSRWPKETPSSPDRNLVPSAQPFTAPAAMPRTKDLPETK